MTDTKILLLDLLAVIPDGDKSAALFAEDGVLELPFLHAVGIPNSLRGSYGDQGVLIISWVGSSIRTSDSSRKTSRF